MEKEEQKLRNPYAFPNQATNDSNFIADGMTLRDYFAAKTMQGICVNAGRNSFDYNQPERIAEYSYSIADAMLKQRELESKR